MRGNAQLPAFLKLVANEVMQKLFIVLILLGLSPLVHAQLTDSNLPIVIITTPGSAIIPDQPRISANMKIVYNGPGVRNFVDDQTDPAKLNYDGKILIETRGSSSQFLDKKQYGFSTVMDDNVTNNNVSLLGMPKEHDWVLNGLAFDASFMRDYIAYTLSRRIGNYAPRQEYCEVVINGSYRGVYLLQEKIKVDNNRVDIVKIDPFAAAGPNLTGGYIVKADKVTAEDPSSFVLPTYLGTNTDFINEYPSASKITQAERIYIQDVFNDLAAAATNSEITSGYPSIIDVPSFVDFMLINELAANVDAYQFSTFFHKDKNGKLRAGPLWDLNLTFGNDLTFWGLDRSHTDTWQFDNGDNIGPKFWRDLYNNPTFHCYLSRRWNELISVEHPLNSTAINALIDETVAYIQEGTTRETGSEVSFRAEQIKNFIAQRTDWMTDQLGSFSACYNISTVPLVISKIHYHPQTSTEFPDEDDLEFVEITNNSNVNVNVTGCYFSGTGFVYQFPKNTTLKANEVIQLASNPGVFKSKYGYYPFGHYIHNLSNSSQKLTLADAFGNVIDQVEYFDLDPWPLVDGNGSYLKLTDLSSDNNVGSNWTASSEAISSTVVVVSTEEDLEASTEVAPNPTAAILNVSSIYLIQGVDLLDARGQSVYQQSNSSKNTRIDITGFPRGLYFLKIRTNAGVITKKIVKG